MKKIGILLLSFIILSACSNNDDNTEVDAELTGTWMLTNIGCFCGFDPETNFNDFSLNFNASENTVIVDNPREDYFYIANSGTFEYSINGDILRINGSDDFKYTVDGDILTLIRVDNQQIADDELDLTYKKVL
tara:strand:+ start:764 stop:1162 length:399 start_codon:yes stop_codon:yes gene_type:complete